MTTNPFGTAQTGALDPGAEFPVPLLVHSALGGTVDDEITEHAENLFATLDERGTDAWRQTALLLTQFILSGDEYGSGEQAAQRYLAQQPAPSPQQPVLTALHGLNAACIRTGTAAARDFLKPQPAQVLKGVTRYQFCVAAGCAGYPKNRLDALLDQLCSDEDGKRLV